MDSFSQVIKGEGGSGSGEGKMCVPSILAFPLRGFAGLKAGNGGGEVVA